MSPEGKEAIDRIIQILVQGVKGPAVDATL